MQKSNNQKQMRICHFQEACAPSLQKLAEQLPDLTVVKVDVDQAREVAVGFGVRAVPTLVLLKDGNVVNQKSGAMTLAQLHQFVSG